MNRQVQYLSDMKIDGVHALMLAKARVYKFENERNVDNPMFYHRLHQIVFLYFKPQFRNCVTCCNNFDFIRLGASTCI